MPENDEVTAPGLDRLTREPATGWLFSAPTPVPMFGGKLCRIGLEGYEDDERPAEFHVAIANFLAGGPNVLRQAETDLFRYYKDFEDLWVEEEGFAPIETADALWRHVRTGDEPMISRRPYGDRGLYVSIECECDWEPEHGLQIVLKNGLKVSKLGPYNGHLTNTDAYGDSRLEDVIFVSFRR